MKKSICHLALPTINTVIFTALLERALQEERRNALLITIYFMGGSLERSAVGQEGYRTRFRLKEEKNTRSTGWKSSEIIWLDAHVLKL